MWGNVWRRWNWRSAQDSTYNAATFLTPFRPVADRLSLIASFSAFLVLFFIFHHFVCAFMVFIFMFLLRYYNLSEILLLSFIIFCVKFRFCFQIINVFCIWYRHTYPGVFLVAFVKLWKATVSSYPSVLQSVRMEKLDSRLTNLDETW
jgi:hypothetical protein